MTYPQGHWDYCACGCGERLPPPEPRRYLPGHRQRHGNLREDRGYKTPCLIAQGRTSSGYIVRSRSRNGVIDRYLAHVRAWEEANGQSLPQGMVVDHLCGQPACIEPSHLHLATQAENVRRSSAAKLTAEQAREIRRDTQYPATYFAEKFGVSAPAVRNVRKGVSWKGV